VTNHISQIGAVDPRHRGIYDALTLELTCYACPEQYDVYLGEALVGYLRLRHGSFTVEVPDCGGKLVYKAHPEGEGIFMHDERDFYLDQARRAIAKELYDNPYPTHS